MSCQRPPDFREKPAVFSTDEEALRELAECRYEEQPLTLEMCLRGEQPRKARVYADGVFDLFHMGHAQMIHQAYNCIRGPIYLIVGLNNDPEVTRAKRRPFLSIQERANLLRHIRYVDEVVVDAPFHTTADFVREHKIDFVCHDPQPYPSGDIADIYGFAKQAGKFIPTHRTPGISTTELMARLREYFSEQEKADSAPI